MNPNEPFVITISREVGSGGHTVGRILAEKLNVRYCDKDLIKALEKKFNLTVEEIERLKGEKKKWLSDFFQYFTPLPTPKSVGLGPVDTDVYGAGVTTDDIYKAETEILKEVANEGSCVIAGRTGFHVFRTHPNHLNVFITASEGHRLKRIMEKQGIDEESASALIKEVDGARENYIKRYTGTSRYDARNYDLVMNADGHTEEQLANILMTFILSA